MKNSESAFEKNVVLNEETKRNTERLLKNVEINQKEKLISKTKSSCQINRRPPISIVKIFQKSISLSLFKEKS
jgi:hypothetical protein